MAACRHAWPACSALTSCLHARCAGMYGGPAGEASLEAMLQVDMLLDGAADVRMRLRVGCMAACSAMRGPLEQSL